MSQQRLILLLFMPSWLSFIICTGVALLVIGLANWSYFTYNPVLYDFFYGERGIITTFEQSPGAVSMQDLTANTALYSAGVVILAVAVAAAMFFMVRGAQRGVGAATHVGRGVDRREYLQHALLRLFIGGLWAGYTLLALRLFIPTALLYSRIGAEDFFTVNGILVSIGAGILFWLLLHAHMVFARLLCLRPRVFGGKAAIEGAMIR